MSANPNRPQQPAYEQPAYGQSIYTQPQAPYEPSQPYGQPQWGQQTAYAPPQQPPKKRRRWPLILAIVATVLVLAFVGGIAAVFLAVNNSPAKAVSQQYYDAIKNHDAAKAYSYLDPTIKLTFQGQSQQINEQTFAQVLQAYDQAKGPVSDYSISSINISTSTSTGNTANVTVRVTRSGNSYDVHLQLRQEGNDWKILSFDGI
jgi:Putative lumazine-binding